MVSVADAIASSRRGFIRAVLPALIPYVEPYVLCMNVEDRPEQMARAFDLIGGVDYALRAARGGIRTLASRVQTLDWQSYTARKRTGRGSVDTEWAKRMRAFLDRELLPHWTTQGYLDSEGYLRQAGIVETADWVRWVLANPRVIERDRINGEDGAVFFPVFWSEIRDALPSQRTVYARPAPYVAHGALSWLRCEHEAARYYSAAYCGEEWRCLPCWQSQSPVTEYGQPGLPL